MSKPATEEDLSRQIAEDRTWRVREISDLKTAILRADSVSQRVLLRALVAICYAHWEGNVRFVARKYLEHVALRRFSFSELSRQFLKNYFLPRLAQSPSRASIAERCLLVDEILDASGLSFSRSNPDLVDTRSNLNFDVFSDICTVCGVQPEPYVNSRTFIDVLLLKRRNAIAHGENTFIDLSDLDNLAQSTINLMRTFGDDVENIVAQKTYRAA